MLYLGEHWKQTNKQKPDLGSNPAVPFTGSGPQWSQLQNGKSEKDSGDKAKGTLGKSWLSHCSWLTEAVVPEVMTEAKEPDGVGELVSVC